MFNSALTLGIISAALVPYMLVFSSLLAAELQDVSLDHMEFRDLHMAFRPQPLSNAESGAIWKL
jgi:hypothetical protein